MIVGVLFWLSSIIVNFISFAGYSGIVFFMALESACIPIPSEIIMPFSGFLVFAGRFSLWQVVLWGTLGNLLGSMVAYCIGLKWGRKSVEKYGRYILISRGDLEIADSWFQKYGQAAVFFSRILPVVRTFISLPAGISRMDFKKFCFYTALGSLPWSWALAYFGLKAGENWKILNVYFHKFDVIIAVFIFLAVFWWIYRHFKRVPSVVK